jgi:hypothetical protein
LPDRKLFTPMGITKVLSIASLRGSFDKCSRRVGKETQTLFLSFRGTELANTKIVWEERLDIVGTHRV